MSPYDPVEVLQPAVIECVLREVSHNDFQYVPLAEEQIRNPGERVFHGEFRRQVECFGPHKSHKRTICLPNGALTERRL